MTLSPSYPRTSWFFKFCESTLAAIAVLNVLMMGLEFLPPSFWEKYGQYGEYIFIAVIVVAVLGSVAYVWSWHRRERKGVVQSGLRHAWLRGIIRYWLALEISTYGF